MSGQQTLVPKKRGPAPTGHGKQIQVRLQPDMLSMVDAFARGQALVKDDGEPKRSLAIQRLITLAAALKGAQVRDPEVVRDLAHQEAKIRASEFYQGNPEAGEAAIRRLFLTGALDTGGASYTGSDNSELMRRAGTEAQDREARFNLAWQINASLARTIDWKSSQ